MRHELESVQKVTFLTGQGQEHVHYEVINHKSNTIGLSNHDQCEGPQFIFYVHVTSVPTGLSIHVTSLQVPRFHK